MTTESTIHKKLWKLFENYGEAGAIMFHIPNGEKRGPKTAANLREMGVVPGVPDFICHSRRYGYRTFYIELKRPGGSRSTAQKAFHAKASDLAIDCYTFDDLALAANFLREAQILRSDIKFTVSDDPATVAERTAARSSHRRAANPSPQEALTAD